MKIRIIIKDIDGEEHYPIQGVPKKLFMYWQSCNDPITWSITHIPTGLCIRRTQKKETDLIKETRTWWRGLSISQRKEWNFSYNQWCEAATKELGVKRMK